MISQNTKKPADMSQPDYDFLMAKKAQGVSFDDAKAALVTAKQKFAQSDQFKTSNPLLADIASRIGSAEKSLKAGGTPLPPEKRPSEKISEGIEGIFPESDTALGRAGTATERLLKIPGSVAGFAADVGQDIYEGGKQVVGGIKEIQEAGTQGMPVEDRAAKSFRGLMDVGRGTLGAVFSPIGETISRTPGLKQISDYTGGQKEMALDEMSKLLNDAGITPESEQGQAIIAGTDFLMDMLAFRLAGGATKSPKLKAGADMLIKKGSEYADTIKSKVSPDIITKRAGEMTKVVEGHKPLRTFVEKQKARGFDVAKDITESNLLEGSVTNDGVITTKADGGAVTQYRKFLRPQEKVVSNVLKAEGVKLKLAEVEAQMTKAIMDSGLEGKSLTKALKDVKAEIEGYKLRAGEGDTLSVSFLNDAKIDKYSGINYLSDNAKIDKVIAKSLKEMVENNTKSADVKALNAELSRHYANIAFLEKLDGVRVKGGKLGKYFAKTIGAVAGSHLGPLGAIVGAELAGGLQGTGMAKTFGKTGAPLKASPVMESALEGQSKSLGSLKTNQSAKMTNDTTAMPKTLPESTTKVKEGVKTTKAEVPASVAKEAKKFKSADEFAASLRKPEILKKNDLGDLKNKLSSRRQRYENAKKGTKYEKEFDIPKFEKDIPALEKKITEVEKAEAEWSKTIEIIKELEAAGVKTKSQLTDIWNKANKSSSGFSKAATPQTIFKSVKRDPSLTGSAKKIQEASIRKYADNQEALIKEYGKRYGKKINTDDARNLFRDVGYNGTNSASVHSAASALAKDVWRDGLKDAAGKKVRIMGGGSGSGKSTAVRAFGDGEVQLTLDGNLSKYDSALERIKEAKAAGANVEISYVYREPVDAYVDGVLKRMLDSSHPEEAGRVVPIDIHVGNHKGALDVARRLKDEGYNINLIDNSLGYKKAKPFNMKKFDSLKMPEGLEKTLRDITTKKKGEMTPAQFEALMR
jgi:hypothetical protein